MTHHLTHKRSVVHSLTHRANTIVTTEDDKLTEIQHVQSALLANNFPPWALNTPKAKSDKKPQHHRGREPTNLQSSYHMSTIYLKNCSGYSRNTASTPFTSHATPSAISWYTPKTRLPTTKNAVYYTRLIVTIVKNMLGRLPDLSRRD